MKEAVLQIDLNTVGVRVAEGMGDLFRPSTIKWNSTGFSFEPMR